MTHEIKICMGSACFAKGNQENLEYIKEFIKERNIIPDVVFLDPPRKGCDKTALETILKMFFVKKLFFKFFCFHSFIFLSIVFTCIAPCISPNGEAPF